jgi:hypothetical protein
MSLDEDPPAWRRLVGNKLVSSSKIGTNAASRSKGGRRSAVAKQMFQIIARQLRAFAIEPPRSVNAEPPDSVNTKIRPTAQFLAAAGMRARPTFS